VVVGPRGDFAWLCFPRWDADALFSSLLGGGGSYLFDPEGRYVWGGF
jgi:alpha,alpha-trehalase